MNYTETENDSLREAVSAVGVGVTAAATLSRERGRSPDLGLLKKIEDACESSRHAVDFYRHWAKLGENVLERIRSDLGGRIDRTGELDTQYKRALEDVHGIAQAVSESIRNVTVDPRLNGMTHRSDLVESYNQCLEAVTDLAEMVADIRAAIIQHDAAISQVELSQEELEHVQRCGQTPVVPKRSMADSINKLKTLLNSGFTLSR